jgi:hypothetical protein
VIGHDVGHPLEPPQRQPAIFPLSGIGVSRTQSKAEIRSVATSSSTPSSLWQNSRTFPEYRCLTAGCALREPASWPSCEPIEPIENRAEALHVALGTARRPTTPPLKRPGGRGPRPVAISTGSGEAKVSAARISSWLAAALREEAEAEAILREDHRQVVESGYAGEVARAGCCTGLSDEIPVVPYQAWQDGHIDDASLSDAVPEVWI